MKYKVAVLPSFDKTQHLTRFQEKTDFEQQQQKNNTNIKNNKKNFYLVVCC